MSWRNRSRSIACCGVEDRGDPKVVGKERITRCQSSPAPPEERSEAALPRLIGCFVLEEHLNVAADPLDAGVERKDDLEGHRKEREGHQGGGRDRCQRSVRQDGGRPAKESDQRNPHPCGAALSNRGAEGFVFLELAGVKALCPLRYRRRPTDTAALARIIHE